MKNSITRKLKKIKMIAMDVDGVLTGGEIIILGSGEEIKIWNAKDRIAFRLARNSGGKFKFAWISGRKSEDVRKRAEELKVDALFMACMDKADAYRLIKGRFGFSDDEMAFIGDDLVDIPVLKRVGLAVCPADAVEEVRKISDYVSRYPGGKGVFRDLVEKILKAQKMWPEALKEFSA